MLWRLFSIYDSKAECYLPPFHFKSRGEAIRSFSDTANDPKSQLCRHPEDFTLFALGEYDDSDATFTTLKTPEPLGKALEFKSNEIFPINSDARHEPLDLVAK